MLDSCKGSSLFIPFSSCDLRTSALFIPNNGCDGCTQLNERIRELEKEIDEKTAVVACN